ncbi:MAG: cupredoxin domain-containing protein [Bacillota bacterium]|nr:MAG: hypothetical protein DIU55_04110 [Bacillota bacterium]
MVKEWLRRAVALVTAAVLVAGLTGGALGAEAGGAEWKQRIEAARDAAPDLVAAAAAGDPDRFRAAYERLAAALEPVLPAVRAADPRLAARMAGARSMLRGFLERGVLSEEDVAREVAVLHGALEEALRTLAGPDQRLIVVAREYRFEPVEMRVKAGSRVVVRLVNRGRVPHEFRIPELGVTIGPVEPGRSAEGAFTVERPGTYTYESRVDGHYLRGMRGRLVVE